MYYTKSKMANIMKLINEYEEQYPARTELTAKEHEELGGQCGIIAWHLTREVEMWQEVRRIHDDGYDRAVAVERRQSDNTR